MRKQRKPSGPLKAKLLGAVRKGRRETIYKMLGKQHDGIVPCFECGHHVPEVEATLEHIVEQSEGGTDDMDNLSISHEICNYERSNGMPVNYSLAEPALNAAGIDLTADFHTLVSRQVNVLSDLAKAQGYRKPNNASGSLARYYFAALARQQRKEKA